MPAELDGALRLGSERMRYYEVDAKIATNVTRKPKESKDKSGKGSTSGDAEQGK